ncbi:meiotic recombination protein SPO11, putative (SPO11) [Plasmodium ovale wallikeri]|uniref:Meiotic recombination protein SPO11, putative (SPO11) n=1 Tax=Plasmodium ovale wallikeri TaxID=864142 RepID=A0A1A8ZYN2_PLAOA|nr:meiotic recombination protein SPO11, putative (SPO11) [Plasmodium ovale wallikeri]SBT49000.1 meiotic recombination protein SPO11, putative (SPO11) [Plasmodium ovale wallikeri]
MDDNSDVICLLEKYVFDFLLKLVNKQKKNCISKNINTRQLIFEIHRRNRRIMFFCLTDYDAYGLNIAFTYSSKFESKVYYVEDISIDRLRWLNLFTPEKALEKNVLKEIDLSKLTSKDIRILDKFTPMLERNGEKFTILMRIYIHECIVSAKLKSSNKFRTVEAKHWMEHINNMKKSGFKYEIDTIADMEKHLDARINELLRT